MASRVPHALAACSFDTKAILTMFVAPGAPKGMPATTVMRSPTFAKPSRTANFAARAAVEAAVE